MSIFSKPKVIAPPPAPTQPTLATRAASFIDSTPTGANAYITPGPVGLKRKTSTMKPTLLGGV